MVEKECTITWGRGASFHFLIILPTLLVSRIILLLMVCFFLYLCENPSQMMVWVQPLYLLLSVVWQIDIGLGGKDNTWTPWRYHFTKVGRFSKRPLTTNLLLLNHISTIKCPFPSSKWWHCRFFLSILFYLKISKSWKHEWLTLSEMLQKKDNLKMKNKKVHHSSGC